MSDESSVRKHINDLVDEERSLREQLAKGEITVDEERSRLTAVEVELDQLWDLLRQRQARAEFHQNPDEAATRSGSTVEGYLQ